MAFSQLKETLVDSRRIAGVDYLRALAILAVMLFHFKLLPYGDLGVDLFFVISGFLVSQPLLKVYLNRQPVPFRAFYLARALKIWPSYYFFLTAGMALASLLYAHSRPQEIIDWNHLPRYVFFFLNYRGTNHWIFDHIWSLCVEEHFYLLLPPSIYLLARWGKNSTEKLFITLTATILLGNILRLTSYLIHFDSFSATHNRIDALAWGVLLAALLQTGNFKPRMQKIWLLPLGLALVGLGIVLSDKNIHPIFQLFVLHGLAPLGFFFSMMGSLPLPQYRILWPLRILAYYSYALYLWHTIFIFVITDQFDHSALGFLVFCAIGLGLAMITTHLVEEPILKLKPRILTWVQRTT